MKMPLLLFAAVLMVGPTSCQLFQDSTPTATTVAGVLLNKYTRQPIVGVPIEVQSWRYSLGMQTVDSITGTHTDASGHYSVAFDATSKGVIYRVGFRDDRQLWDLTDYRSYDQYCIYDGAPLNVGRSNQVNFEATPFVQVRVIVDADKRGAAVLQADAFADERDSQGYFHSFAFQDTTRANGRPMANQIVSFVPNRKYDFSVWRSPVPPASSNSFGTWTRFTRFIGYNDTSVVRLH